MASHSVLLSRSLRRRMRRAAPLVVAACGAFSLSAAAVFAMSGHG